MNLAMLNPQNIPNCLMREDTVSPPNFINRIDVIHIRYAPRHYEYLTSKRN